MLVKVQRRGPYAGLAILVAVVAGLAVAWLFWQPRVDDVQLGTLAPALPEAAKSPTAGAEPAATASAEDALSGDQPPADCLAALATPEASSRLLREQKQQAIERFIEQQGDRRQQAIVADLAGYARPGSKRRFDGLTGNARLRYGTPLAPSERKLSGDERRRLRILLETEGIEALVVSVDAAVLQAHWTPGTSLMAHLIAEHGDALHAALPTLASAMPLGMHELATAIASGIEPADFALLLEAADVDPPATWRWHDANLAKVAAIRIRPQILRLLIARGVDVAGRPTWRYGTILDDIAAQAKPENAATREALADVVRQLTAAGVQPDLPSTLRTLAEWLPGVALPRLNPEVAAVADSLGDAVAAVAALDADWTQRIDAADRLEQRCEAQLADFERLATAFQATGLAAKQRYQEVLRKRQERTWEEWQRKADEQRAAAADEVPGWAGDQELHDAFRLAVQEDQWQEAFALADRIGGLAYRVLLQIALGGDAPLDVVLELVQRHGSLPEDAMESLGFRRSEDAVATAEALEPFGLDVHYVNEEGHNAFSHLAQYFLGTEREWRLAEYLASRSVAVKPRPFGLDPLDRVLMDIVALPRAESEARVRFARFLIEHGAPVEASHLELAAQLFAKDEEAYRRLVDAVPELASRAPGG